MKMSSKFIIGSFVLLYVITSIISTIHVIEFFKLSNPNWLAITLAIAFEVGAAASLASLIVLEKMNKYIVWGLFITLTCMQAMGNTYYAYTHLSDISNWVELFGLNEEEIIYQKRVMSIISGAILPLISLGFIKSLVDYLKPIKTNNKDTVVLNEIITDEPIVEKVIEKSVEIPVEETIDLNDKIERNEIDNSGGIISFVSGKQIK